MNYELAKQLKDAGFPQEHKSGVMMDVDWDESVRPERLAYAYAPTLEELIEACGQGFSKLVKSEDVEYGVSFTASSAYKVKGEGSTPTEAVARLWLVLNKK